VRLQYFFVPLIPLQRLTNLRKLERFGDLIMLFVKNSGIAIWSSLTSTTGSVTFIV
jgi:hypothetical protein